MAKTAVKKNVSSAAAKEKKHVKLTKNQKKKKFWKNHPKISAPQPKEKTPSLPLPQPPRGPQEFSSNWKALQALLNSEVKVSVTDPKSTKLSHKEKKVPRTEESTSEGKAKSEPQVKKPALKINGAAKEVKISDKSTKEPAATDKKTRKKRKLQEDGEKHVTPKRKTTEDNTGDGPQIDIWFDDVDPEDIEAALGPEAAQIARKMQGMPEKKSNSVETVLVKDKAFDGLTRTVAMDCEMVGVGENGEDSILARVSIVNQFGKCVFDKFVKPTERVTDYRTEVSGIRPVDVKGGEDFKVVQKEVSEILKGRILVGHALHNDLKILFLDHPKKAIRDTQKYKPFKQQVKSGRPSLKLLCEKLLHVRVQTGEHSSVQDAQAAMRLYTMEKKNWEAAIKAKYNQKKTEPPKQKPGTQ